MSNYIRESIENIAAEFEATGKQFPMLHHILLAGPSIMLATGGLGEWSSVSQSSPGPESKLLTLIANALIHDTHGCFPLSHVLVLISDRAFRDHPDEETTNEFKTYFCRSILFSTNVNVGTFEQEALSLFQTLSRQALQLAIRLDCPNSDVWRDGTFKGTESERRRKGYDIDDEHRWIVGVARLALTCDLVTVAVDHSKPHIIGGPAFVEDPPGTVKPLLVQGSGDEPQQLITPYRVFLGPSLRQGFAIPSDQGIPEALEQMLEGSRVFSLQQDVFSASACAIKWLLSDASIPPGTPAGVALMSAKDLAERHGLDAEALRKRLDRERIKNHDCFIEIESSERKRNEPQYLYRPDRVQHIIDNMLQTPKTSIKRPTR